VDGRQVVGAIKVGAEKAKGLNFQYTVTINKDDAFEETTGGNHLERPREDLGKLGPECMTLVKISRLCREQRSRSA
jgi:hypothetical protein